MAARVGVAQPGRVEMGDAMGDAMEDMSESMEAGMTDMMQKMSETMEKAEAMESAEGRK